MIAPLHNSFINRVAREGLGEREVTKRKTGLLRDKRAVSPVIATVILVAVTIVVAVAVAYWMGGIAGLYTRYEQVEISSAYAIKDTDHGYWNITVELKNTGSADATLDNLLVNGKPYAQFEGNINVTVDGSELPATINSGDSKTADIEIMDGTSGCSSGTTIELKFHSATGAEYTRLLTLP